MVRMSLLLNFPLEIGANKARPIIVSRGKLAANRFNEKRNDVFTEKVDLHIGDVGANGNGILSAIEETRRDVTAAQKDPPHPRRA